MATNQRRILRGPIGGDGHAAAWADMVSSSKLLSGFEPARCDRFSASPMQSAPGCSYIDSCIDNDVLDICRTWMQPAESSALLPSGGCLVFEFDRHRSGTDGNGHEKRAQLKTLVGIAAAAGPRWRGWPAAPSLKDHYSSPEPKWSKR